MDYREGERTIPTSDRSNGWTVETVKRALHSQPTHIHTHKHFECVGERDEAVALEGRNE